MTRRWHLSLLLLTLALCGPSRPAHALKVAPFKSTITPGNSQVFRIENNTDEAAAVQVSVVTWDVALDGTETNRDAEADFIVFPPQVVLAPHESRAVRIQWLGDPAVPVEKAYRLIAEQLPVKLQETPSAGSGVKFMLRFKAALYIASGAVQSHIVATAAAAATPGKLAVTLHNDGNGHTLLQHAVLHLKLADGRLMDLSGVALQSLEGENIHAGATRVFEIPFSSPASIAATTIDYTPAF